MLKRRLFYSGPVQGSDFCIKRYHHLPIINYYNGPNWLQITKNATVDNGYIGVSPVFFAEVILNWLFQKCFYSFKKLSCTVLCREAF